MCIRDSCTLDVDERILKEPKLELGTKHSCHSLINRCHRYFAFRHELRQKRVAVGIWKFHIDSSFQCLPGSISAICGYFVSRNELRYSVVIRCNQPAESPLLPEELFNQP